jgi:prepilin-type N-terminal cleavage/methylation domain-containing protein
MASPKICVHSQHNKKGFTLLEIILAMAILFSVIAFGLAISYQDFQSSSFRNERDSLVAAMRRARSLAMNNV